MARGAPSYVTGTVAAQSTADDVVDLFLPIIETQLGTYQTNSVSAWQVFDDIDAGLATRDRVWQSRGDRTLGAGAGDTRLYVRITRNLAQLRFNVYQDWSTLSSTGSRNPGPNTLFISSAELTYFFCYNEYEFHFIVNQGSSWAYTGFLNPARVHVPSQIAGVAFTTAAVTAGGPVTVGLDRDISGNIRVGQRVFFIRQTDPGAALESAEIEAPVVTAVTSTTVTVDSLLSNYVGGSIVGFDPCCFGCESTTSGALTFLNTHGADGVSLLSSNQSMIGQFFDNTSESDEDPAPTGFFQGARMQLQDNVFAVPNGSWRGRSDCVVYWGVNGQTDPDDIMRDVTSGVGYRPFPQLLDSNRLMSFYDPSA